MSCLNERETRVFQQIMEGMPFLEIADKNSLTLYEFIECRDIIIEKLNQGIVAYPEKEDHP